MGYGFPAAIGAQLALPDKKVIVVAGDGSIQMNIQELATAVANRLPVKVVILNNGHLGMVRQWQELSTKGNYSQTNMEAQPDFCEACRSLRRGWLSHRKAGRSPARAQKPSIHPIRPLSMCGWKGKENVYPYRSGRRGPGRNAAGLGEGAKMKKTCSFRAG